MFRNSWTDPQGGGGGGGGGNHNTDRGAAAAAAAAMAGNATDRNSGGAAVNQAAGGPGGPTAATAPSLTAQELAAAAAAIRGYGTYGGGQLHYAPALGKIYYTPYLHSGAAGGALPPQVQQAVLQHQLAGHQGAAAAAAAGLGYAVLPQQLAGARKAKGPSDVIEIQDDSDELQEDEFEGNPSGQAGEQTNNNSGQGKKFNNNASSSDDSSVGSNSFVSATKKHHRHSKKEKKDARHHRSKSPKNKHRSSLKDKIPSEIHTEIQTTKSRKKHHKHKPFRGDRSSSSSSTPSSDDESVTSSKRKRDKSNLKKRKHAMTERELANMNETGNNMNQQTPNSKSSSGKVSSGSKGHHHHHKRSKKHRFSRDFNESDFEDDSHRQSIQSQQRKLQDTTKDSLSQPLVVIQNWSRQNILLELDEIKSSQVKSAIDTITLHVTGRKGSSPEEMREILSPEQIRFLAHQLVEDQTKAVKKAVNDTFYKYCNEVNDLRQREAQAAAKEKAEGGVPEPPSLSPALEAPLNDHPEVLPMSNNGSLEVGATTTTSRPVEVNNIGVSATPAIAMASTYPEAVQDVSGMTIPGKPMAAAAAAATTTTTHTPAASMSAIPPARGGVVAIPSNVQQQQQQQQALFQTNRNSVDVVDHGATSSIIRLQRDEIMKLRNQLAKMDEEKKKLLESFQVKHGNMRDQLSICKKVHYRSVRAYMRASVSSLRWMRDQVNGSDNETDDSAERVEME